MSVLREEIEALREITREIKARAVGEMQWESAYAIRAAEYALDVALGERTETEFVDHANRWPILRKLGEDLESMDNDEYCRHYRERTNNGE